MTQENIYIMDRIIDEMIMGKKLSEALRVVYDTRNIVIPYCDKMFDVELSSLKLSVRTYNALRNVGINTLNDAIEFAAENSLKGIRNLGKRSGIELLETILDLAWKNMTEKESVDFLIDIVKRNEDYVRKEIM